MIERKETPINEVSKKDLLKRDGLTFLLGFSLVITFVMPFPRPGLPSAETIEGFLFFPFVFYYPFIIYVSFIIYWKLIKKVEIPSWFWLVGREAVFSLRPPRR